MTPTSVVLNSQKHLFQQGFTLLELLLVVTILSSTAMVAMMTFETTTSQHRIEDTENRLQLLKDATVKTMTYNGQNFDMGYVVDNGFLPPCVDGLLSATDCNASTGGTSAMASYGVQSPIYDFSNTTNSTNPPLGEFNNSTGGEITLDQSNEQLLKGHRPIYLSGVTDEFRDGWGNDSPVSTAEDANNFSWVRTETSGVLTYTSYGRDNIDSVANTYSSEAQDQNQVATTQATEWSVPAGTTITVKITNKNIEDSSDLDINNVIIDSSSSATNYSIVLLEFVNGEDRGFWRHSDAGIQSWTATGVNYFYGTKDPLQPTFDVNKDTLKPCDNSDPTNPCGSSSNPYGSIEIDFTLSHDLAVGEHILMLVGHNGTNPIGETACLDLDGDTNCDVADDGPDADSDADRLTHKFTVYSKIGIPNNTINWEIN